ncbi:transposable element Tcb1 transposase [Trichonephila clavipes]|nr:transposable element Tcb1 transposase [Trichonephila clavipes]
MATYETKHMVANSARTTHEKSRLQTWEIGSRAGRNQTTAMRICDRWMQEGTTDRRGRSHSPQCTISLPARTIQRRLQQSGLSARPPLLGHILDAEPQTSPPPMMR